MTYIKLSEQVEKLTNPQRSDAFIKQLRDAVREGQFDAAAIKSRFTLPKQFRSRSQEGTYQRDTRDMVIEVTPEFEAWFKAVNLALTPARSDGKVKPTLEHIEAGVLDFKALAAETRRKLEAGYSKGQQLGSSRSKNAPAKKRAAVHPRK